MSPFLNILAVIGDNKYVYGVGVPWKTFHIELCGFLDMTSDIKTLVVFQQRGFHRHEPKSCMKHCVAYVAQCGSWCRVGVIPIIDAQMVVVLHLGRLGPRRSGILNTYVKEENSFIALSSCV